MGSIGADFRSETMPDAAAESPSLWPALVIIAILGLGGMLTLGSWNALWAAGRRQLIREVEGQTLSIQQGIQASLEERVWALTRMARRWEKGGRPTREQWMADAREYYDHQSGYQALEWVDPTFRVSWIVPLEGNEAAVDLDLSRDPIRRRAMEDALSLRNMVATPSVTLAQGGTGVLLFFPLFVAERFDGFLLAVVNHEALLRSILRPEIAPRYGVTVSTGDQTLYARRAKLRAEDLPSSRNVDVGFPGMTWQVRVWLPHEEVDRIPRRDALGVAFGGLCLTLLLATSVGLGIRAERRRRSLMHAHRRLHAEMDERTLAEAALLSSEERLRLATEAGRMGTWDWDVKTDLFRHSSILPALFGLPDTGQPIPRRTFLEMTHDDDREEMDRANEALLRGESVEGLEFRAIAPDGTIRWLAAHTWCVRDDFGQPARMVGIATDIGQRKSAAREREALVTELQAANGVLTELSRRLMDVQERERRDLSRDLHDETAQCLAAVKIDLQRFCGDHPEITAHSTVADALATVDRLIEHIGALCLDLRPALLDDLGLAAALRSYVNRQAERTRIAAEFLADDLPPLPERIKVVCFRVAQEALTNIIRHANASKVVVHLRWQDDAVLLRIEDNGIGFVRGEPGKRDGFVGGLGLLGMRERVLGVGGYILVDSQIGRGTRIEARVSIAHSRLPPFAAS